MPSANRGLWTKYGSVIHNNANSSEKVYLLLSLTLSWFRRDHFFTGGSLIMDYGLFLISSGINGWKLKHLNDRFAYTWLLQMLTDGLEIIVMFLSDSHSDGTHSLQSIHCWDTDAETHFSKSDEETNSSTSWMAWGCVHLQQIFIFGWTAPLWCYFLDDISVVSGCFLILLILRWNMFFTGFVRFPHKGLYCECSPCLWVCVCVCVCVCICVCVCVLLR